MKQFSVKAQLLEEGTNGVRKLTLVNLGENLSWSDAVALRKENRGSYIHPENIAFQDESKKVFTPEVVVKQIPLKKHRVRTN